MVHVPVLSTNLFEGLSASRIPAGAPKPEPFNLFKFLYLRGEIQQIIDIYEAFYDSTEEEQPNCVVSAQAKPKLPKRNSKNEERFQRLRAEYSGLIHEELKAEDDYWAGFAYAAVGKPLESEGLFKRSFSSGYHPAAALLSDYAKEAGEFELANKLLDFLGPFDALKPLDRALAYRERGKLLESVGRFSEARAAYRTTWDILEKLPDAQIFLGFSGQLLGWMLEMLGKSQEALEIGGQAKKHALFNRRIRLLYLQILTAARVKKFEEAYLALEELETLVPNNPQFQGMAFDVAGELARFQGQWITAIGHFDNAIVASSGAHTEAAFAASLFASHCSHALGDMDSAVAYLERAAGELFSIDPFLVPGYSARAKANLALRRGAVNAALGKVTAIDHLEDAYQIFADLGLPVGQCLALLQLAGWFEVTGDRTRALELLIQSEKFRKEIQDIASYEVELVLLPQLKPLLAELQEQTS